MATVSDTADASQLPQANFEPEAETTTDTALGESTEPAAAQMASFQPSAQMSAQFTRADTTSSPIYSRGTLPPTGAASNLPGAFFFLTMTYYNGNMVQVVAYDPWVIAGNKAADIQDFYKTNIKSNLPYYEYFDDTATGPWKWGDKYYSGTYGSKDAANKGFLSPLWYFTGNTASAIANGVNVAFWNQKADSSGLFTSAPTQKFDKSATTVVMKMYPASGQNFILSGNNYLKAAQVDFYAMINGKLG